MIYAIGDIHGRLDLLEAAARRIRTHDGGRGGTIICLGDYVDRGPDSRGVIEFLMQAERTERVICLKGNHEDMMLQACRERDRAAADHWLMNGGDATLRSYGVERPTTASLDVVPEHHLAWMESLPATAADSHHIYVHAGLMPGVPLADQDDDVLLWIRERFLRVDRAREFPDGKHIVHGHTPSWAGKPEASAPELLDLRTNLDTGAVYSGVLTVGVFDPDLPGGPVEVLAIAKA